MTVRQRVLLGGLALCGAAQAVLARQGAAGGGILAHRYALLAGILLWGLLGAVGVACALQAPARQVLGLLLVIGVLVPVAALSAKAPLSDDLYRYAWDGVVQTSGTDPYRYPPLDPHLASLRDPYLFPPGHYPRINRPAVRTIYPPVAEAWFAVEHLIVPRSAHDLGYEIVGLLLVLALLGVLLALLEDRRRLSLWVLSPLPAVEVVANAHVDALALLLTLLSVLLARRRPLPAVALLAAATLVKLYPAVLLPLLLVDRRARVRKVVLFVGLCGAAYLPHVFAVGRQVIGYLPGYLREEHYGQGSRYLLLGLLGLGGTAASVAVVVLAALALALVLRARLPLPESATRLLVVLLLLATPVQPWYALLLLGCLTAAGAWWALPVTLAAYPLYFAAVLDGDQVLLGRLGYGLAALLTGFLLTRPRQPGAQVSRESSLSRTVGHSPASNEK